MNLVTGASGLAGANLVRALLAAGQGVRALVHKDQRAIDGLPAESVEGDICAVETLAKAFQGVEVVYHLAALISLQMDNWAEVEAINVRGTRNVVEACLRAGVRRLVYFSSIHALRQDPLDQPVDENNAPADGAQFPPYDRSKAQAEREVLEGMQRGLDVVILNPTAMIGPYDYRPSYLGLAVKLMARGRLPALVEGGFDWVDARDVATAAIQAATAARSGERYLLGGHWHSVRELAQLVARVSGRAAPVFTVPMGLAYAALPLARLVARNGSQPIFTRVTLEALKSNPRVSHAKAERELGYQPRPLADTVADTVAWFGEQGK